MNTPDAQDIPVTAAAGASTAVTPVIHAEIEQRALDSLCASVLRLEAMREGTQDLALKARLHAHLGETLANAWPTVRRMLVASTRPSPQTAAAPR